MTRKWFLLRAFLAVISLQAACGPAQQPEMEEFRATSSEHGSAINDLSLRVTTLEEQYKELESEFIELSVKEEIEHDQYSMATFDPAADDGFARIDTSVGSFALSIEDVAAHADGVRVQCHVGNLTSATITGATFKVKWGPRRPSRDVERFLDRYREWKNGLRERDIKTLKQLRPGIWNTVDLTLPGTRTEELGYLELSMETGQISLGLEE